MKPFFSVIIPTYNRANELRRALESVSNQSLRDFEVIVCDDGSTDNTPEVAGIFADKMALSLVRTENWGGPARPRNIGIRAARGEWVCFLDSDDWWYPQKLETVLAFTSRADVIHHKSAVYDANGKKLLAMKGRQLTAPVFVDLLTGWNALHTSTVCIRKSLLEAAGGFTEEKELIAIEDFDLWIRISRLTDSFVYLDQLLGAYWLSSGNISEFSTASIAREVALFDRYVMQLAAEDRSEARKMISYRQGVVNWHLRRYGESRKMFTASLYAQRSRTRIFSYLWIMVTFLSQIATKIVKR